MYKPQSIKNKNSKHCDRISTNFSDRHYLAIICLGFLASLILPAAALAHSNGITGFSGKTSGNTCAKSTCHLDTNSFNAASTIVKSGTTTIPSSAYTGLSYNFSVQVTGTGSAAGFDLAASAGSLASSQSGVSYDATTGELTHSTPQSIANNQAVWNFTWTSPSTAGTVNLYLCGNVVNLDNRNTGDDPACTVVPISVTKQTVVDNTPPVIGSLPDLTANAFSFLTPYTLPLVTATDNVDGTIGATADNTGPYFSGTTVITWTATDSSGNTTTAPQNLLITPTIYTANSRSVSSTAVFTYNANLSGDAVSYPVSIPVNSTGTAVLNTDFTLSSNTISIANGQTGSVTVTVAPSALNKTITLELGSSGSGQYNLSSQVSQSYSVSNIDMAPVVELGAVQGSVTGDVVTHNPGGVVTVTATANDPDGNNASLVYDWNSSDTAVLNAPSTSISSNTLSFDAADLVAGLYEIKVNVSDATGSTLRTLYISVVNALPTLTAADTDQDGTPDDVESIFDNDYDGVADYLDFTSNQSVLATDASTNIHQYIEAIPGTVIRTGNLARLSGSQGALVKTSNLSNLSLSPGLAPANTNAFYDFEIKLTPNETGPVTVSLPVGTALFNVDQLNVYSTGNGWHLFTADTNNYLQYANANNGICPPPASPSYVSSGKNTTSCVELTITDGGPNDVDNSVNGVIQFRAGSIGSIVITPDSGGGAGEYLFIMMMLAWVWRRHIVMSQKEISVPIG